MTEPTQPSLLPDFDTSQNNTAQPDATHISQGWAADEIPSSANFNWLMAFIGFWVRYLYNLLPYWLGQNANEVLTITAGAVVPTLANSTFQNAGGTINNATPTNFKTGRVWVARGNGSNPVVLNHLAGGSGQFSLSGSISATLTLATDTIAFQLDAAGKWVEMWRGAQYVGFSMIIYSAAGPYTFVVPANVTSIIHEDIGGGGGGGGMMSGDTIGSGGGGAGAFQKFSQTVTPGSSLSVVVGAGGPGGVGTPPGLNSPGQNGGASGIGGNAAFGGLGGHGGSADSAPGAGGLGWTASTSSTARGIDGGDGGNHTTVTGGVGGISPDSFFDPKKVAAAAAATPTKAGMGGGGASTTGSTTGGAGAPGRVIIYY